MLPTSDPDTSGRILVSDPLVADKFFNISEFFTSIMSRADSTVPVASDGRPSIWTSGRSCTRSPITYPGTVSEGRSGNRGGTDPTMTTRV